MNKEAAEVSGLRQGLDPPGNYFASAQLVVLLAHAIE